MQIILYDATGAVESIVIAALLREELPAKSYPGHHLLAILPYFAVKNTNPGRPLYLGNDSAGNQIYALAVGNERWLAPKAIRSILELFDLPQEKILLVDAQKYSNPLIKLGGFLAVNLSLPALGKPLLFLGLRKSYSALERYAVQIKTALG